MRIIIPISLFIICLNVIFEPALRAQVSNPPTVTNKEWAEDFQPFRICGNLYYVGSYELACYLITTSKGLILINTGLAASTPMIQNHIKALGFHFEDIKILLTTQAHFDHVGAMAEVKRLTGAKLMADEKDAQVLDDGGNSDYLFGGKGTLFQPVLVDRTLKNNDIIALGNTRLVFKHHPGHTKGSCSYLLTTPDHGKRYRVLIANIPTILSEAKLPSMASYPNISNDYRSTIDSMRQLKFDIWVASHASQFNLHKKYKPGDPYNPEVFNDRPLYDESLNDVEKQLKENLNNQGKEDNLMGYLISITTNNFENASLITVPILRNAIGFMGSGNDSIYRNLFLYPVNKKTLTEIQNELKATSFIRTFMIVPLDSPLTKSEIFQIKEVFNQVKLNSEAVTSHEWNNYFRSRLARKYSYQIVIEHKYDKNKNNYIQIKRTKNIPAFSKLNSDTTGSTSIKETIGDSLVIVHEVVVENVVEDEIPPPPPPAPPKNIKAMSDDQLKNWLIKHDSRKLNKKDIKIRRTDKEVMFIINVDRGNESFSYLIK